MFICPVGLSTMSSEFSRGGCPTFPQSTVLSERFALVDCGTPSSKACMLQWNRLGEEFDASSAIVDSQGVKTTEEGAA
jgi:hypothetical protein